MKENIDKICLTTIPQKVFRNVQHYKKVRMAILTALANSKRNNCRDSDRSCSYLINRLSVEFTIKVTSEEIYIDYLKGMIVLIAPTTPNESKQSIAERRISYYSSLLRSVETMAIIGITNIYLLLNNDGRKELEPRRARKKYSNLVRYTYE